MSIPKNNKEFYLQQLNVLSYEEVRDIILETELSNHLKSRFLYFLDLYESKGSDKVLVLIKDKFAEYLSNLSLTSYK